MKTKILFPILSFAFSLFLLALLPSACKNAESSQADAVETEQEEVEPAEDISPSSERSSEVAVSEPEERAEEMKPSKAVDAKKVNSQSTEASKPAAPEKSASSQSKVKTTETPAPKVEIKPEAENANEEAPAPKAVKKEEPAPPQTTPAPKAQPVAPPTVVETKKIEESSETKPAAPAPQASKWPVPDSYNKKANPVNADSESIALGKSLWAKHCKSCHGKDGLGDGPKAAQLDTSCGDFTSKSFQSQSDGALFYKTIEGKEDMPSYKKKIPDEDDIWHLVNYMRTMK